MTHRCGRPPERGTSLIEVMLALAVAGTLAAMAVPQWGYALDDFRARSAARHLARHLALARGDAVRRSTFVAVRFTPMGDDYQFVFVADGNGNGVRTAEIGVTDLPLAPPDVLGWHYTGVRFGIGVGVPDADNQPVTSSDGVRVGSSRMLSMNPNGSSTAGTLYVLGTRGAQYAVRVLGATARVRMLKYDRAQSRWVEP